MTKDNQHFWLDDHHDKGLENAGHYACTKIWYLKANKNIFILEQWNAKTNTLQGYNLYQKDNENGHKVYGYQYSYPDKYKILKYFEKLDEAMNHAINL